eukprot:2160762-Amphidinium_carterae.3
MLLFAANGDDEPKALVPRGQPPRTTCSLKAVAQTIHLLTCFVKCQSNPPLFPKKKGFGGCLFSKRLAVKKMSVCP